MGLTAKNCVVKADSIAFEDMELTKLSDAKRRNLRGSDMAMIFQEPLTSLNPLFTIGYQLEETIRRHNKVTKAEARETAVAILDKVGIARSREVLSEYPSSLSGGMRQRVMIAMALVNNPSLLIADEPTTALDVTIQAQILQLMRNLMKEFSTAVLFITRDVRGAGGGGGRRVSAVLRAVPSLYGRPDGKHHQSTTGRSKASDHFRYGAESRENA